MATRVEKIAALNRAVGAYFKRNRSQSRVSVNALYEASSELRECFSSAKTVRGLLRQLRDEGTIIKNIPSVIMDVKDVNTNWYFSNTIDSPAKISVDTHPRVQKSSGTATVSYSRSVEKDLLDSSKFVSIDRLPNVKQLDAPGLYCIKLRPGATLPREYMAQLKPDRYIYIGKASGSLRQRFWKQELNAVGHGTFFRSIGAVLGYTPVAGSLKSGRNYKFSTVDEEKIKRWLQNNTLVNCVPVQEEQIKANEDSLILKYRPLLNIQGNPDKLAILEEARKKCLEVALGISQ